MSDIDNTNVNKAGESAMGDQTLRPISIRLLYEGLIIDDDIYDSRCNKLLMAGGNTLGSDQIDRMYRLNGGNDTIYVTGRTQKSIAMKKPNIPIAKRSDLETSTGYAAIFAKVRELYRKITTEEKVDSEGFIAVAEDLLALVDTAGQSDIVALINAITPVDEFIYRHIINVALLNALLARWLKLPEEQVDKLLFIGLLHDCGMALVPQAILHAPRSCTVVEYEVIKMHTVYTDKLLADTPDDIRHTIRAHHERIDASGYPHGISGDKIIGAARITAVSDIYEAVVSTRPYKAPKSPFHALAMFDSIAPEQVDSNVVNTLKKHLPEHLIDKPVTMTDGTIGIVREFDPANIEFPKVELGKRIIKTNARFNCISMYNDE